MYQRKWMRDRCDKMETLDAKHDIFNVHQKLKETGGIFKKCNPPMLVNDTNRIIIDNEEIMRLWETYTRTFWSLQARWSYALPRWTQGSTNYKFRSSIHNQKLQDKKSSWCRWDRLLTELLKIINDSNVQLLINTIYRVSQKEHMALK